jgi:hypothetical protein
MSGQESSPPNSRNVEHSAQIATMRLIASCRFGVLRRLSVALLCVWLAACGSSGSDQSTPPAMPPSISVQPTSTSALNGAAASFAVIAAGEGVAIQWQRSADAAATSWINIAGATTATYNISAADASLNNIQFRAVITNSAGSLTSSAATLTVSAALSPPVVTTSPANQTVGAGASASFSVTASGTALLYQWQSSSDGILWTAIAGATNATLNLPITTLADSGKRFRAVVSGGGQSVNSDAGTLTVNAASIGVQITSQPQAVSLVAPQVASFGVVATGSPAPSYQWQQSSDRGITFTDIALASNANYNTPATSLADNGKLLRVRVSNSSGTVTSANVTLTVTALTAAPVITSQPTAQSVSAPATATFSVVASGTPTPSYQWQVSADGGASFANVNGATTNSYSTSATSAVDNGKRFRVVVSNVAGTAISTAVVLGVSAGGGGSVSTTCASPFALPAGTFVETISSPSTNPNLSLTSNVRVVGPASFQGNAGIQVDVTTGGLAPLSASAFGTFNAATSTQTTFGVISRFGNPGDAVVQDSTSVATPPAADARFGLTAGQSLTTSSTTVETTVVTTNGVAAPPTTKTVTSSLNVTFVGTETLTTPAGTFNTCKFVETKPGSTSSTTKWELVGYGGSVKSVTGTSTTTLTSIKVNGVPLTHFP